MASHSLTHCENCGAALQGPYCHACGQPVVSPVRHAAHAVEEVFESFWHLDGRVFRTLRDLMVPGRLALQYLAGHRVRYIAPLRLFVILSLLTFFVGKLAALPMRPPRQIRRRPPLPVRRRSASARNGIRKKNLSASAGCLTSPTAG